MFGVKQKSKNPYLKKSAQSPVSGKKSAEVWGESRGSWGLALWIGAVAFFGAERLLALVAGFIPFGGLLHALCGIPLAALVAEFVFLRLCGRLPTLLQSIVLVAVGCAAQIFNFTIATAASMADPEMAGASLFIGGFVLVLYVIWGVSAMYFWEQKVL